MAQSLSYVVTGVHDPNECELLALADAALVVSDEIKKNITTLRENNWKIRVMIWSDSHTALKFLQNPNCSKRFGPGRPTKIRNLILKIISEMESLPISAIQFIWIPGRCTKMHETADFMTKNPIVKSGKAPTSRAMIKMMFAKPTAGPRVIEKTVLSADSDSSTDTSRPAIPDKNEVSESGLIQQTRGKTDLAGANISKRPRPADIDGDRPRKIMRPANEATSSPQRTKDGPEATQISHEDSRLAETSPAILSSQPAVHGLGTPPPSTTSDEFADQPEAPIDTAIGHFIRLSSRMEFFDKIMQKITCVRRGGLGQRAKIQSAVVSQLRANEELSSTANLSPVASNGPHDMMNKARFPRIFDVVEKAVSKLPEPCRVVMQAAIAEQLDCNRQRAMSRASLDPREP
ncbi:hypothetical protein Daus18300_004561 [Diaporthe australafricana]|uniref:RNase H type-1 domain-containing protein n=1 Tax=Diaporthe australafricana TaxID=127596 RepID=A0ABR3X7X4_9PEZI